MPRVIVFADESGNFDFSRGRSASRYFILTTVTTDGFAVGDALLTLRRELVWQGVGLNTEFHASTDTQEVRDHVFGVLQQHEFRIDATILEKAKAAPQVRCSEERFYQSAWFQHMKHVTRKIVRPADELLVIGASLGTKKKRQVMHDAVCDVIQQVSRTTAFRAASWDVRSDPCLQVADYCSWAIQRKWEMGDTRSYDLISDKIKTEFDLFALGDTLYY